MWNELIIACLFLLGALSMTWQLYVKPARDTKDRFGFQTRRSQLFICVGSYICSGLLFVWFLVKKFVIES